MSTSRLIQSVLKRSTNPAILPIPPTKTGNNVPKSLHKTRRTWKANTTRYDLPAPVLLDASLKGDQTGEGSRSGMGKIPEIRGVKMQNRRIRDVEKAGGVEGLLLSRPSKDFTPFGRKLRSQLFEELHRLREAQEQAIRDMKEIEDGKIEIAGKVADGSGSSEDLPLIEGR